MASMHDAPWADGWRARIEDAVRAMGYESVTSLLVAHPAVPLAGLTERNALCAAPIQLVTMALREAKGEQGWQWLVADLLCRHIVDACGRGWRSGPKFRWSQTLALSSWISDVLSDGVHPDREDVLSRIATAILDDDLIEDTWVPSCPSDGVIRKHLVSLTHPADIDQ